MPLFQGVGHIALNVTDLDASLAFYTRLGFPEMLRLLNEKGEPWIVYLRVSDALYLELFPGGQGGRVPDARRTGLAHLCLTSEDLDATEAGLRAQGIELSQPRRDGPRRRWQPRDVDRGSRRQPHRDHGDGAGLHPVPRRREPARRPPAGGAGAPLTRNERQSR